MGVMDAMKPRNPLYAKAIRVFVGGAQGRLRREFHALGPLILTEGRGSRLIDIEGRTFIDYHMAFGAIVLGHSDPEVAEAIASQAARLTLHGAGVTDVEILYAELIQSLIPTADKVLFTNSGSEAVLMALRIARAYTGRDLIVKFEGNYHGWHDYSLLNVKTALARGKHPESEGIPRKTIETVEVLPYNDPDTFAEFMEKKGDEIAAVILEPVAHSMGVVPAQKKFIDAIVKYTRRHGALLIFDEIITAVRDNLHGMQSAFGVDPDLTTLGKAIANGLPIAAVVGKEEVMRILEDGVVSSGTYSGNPLVVAGGLAALRKSVRERVDIELARKGAEHAKLVRDLINDYGIRGVVSHFGGAFSIHFGLDEPPKRLEESLAADPIAYRIMVQTLREHGIIVSPNYLKRFHLALAHTEEDMESLHEAMETALKRVKRERGPGPRGT